MFILYSNQIEKILHSHLETKQCFRGVFALDQVPKTFFKFPSCFIVNTHKQNQPGEHWLAVYIDSNMKIDFFDSFGRPPEEFKLHQYLSSISIQINYNKKQIQSVSSSFCGYYCLFFILSKVRGMSMDKFVSMFSENTEKNDDIINSFLEEFI